MSSREQSSDPEALGPIFDLRPMYLAVPPRMARRLRCYARTYLGDMRKVREFALAALAVAITDDELQARQLIRADRNGSRRWPETGARAAAGTGPRAEKDRSGSRVIRLRTPR